MDEAEGLLVILVRRLHTVGVAANRALALGVVGDVGDERRPDGLAVLFGAAQIDVDRIQQICVVEFRPVNALIRRRDRNGAVERVIFRGARKGPAFERLRFATSPAASYTRT